MNVEGYLKNSRTSKDYIATNAANTSRGTVKFGSEDVALRHLYSEDRAKVVRGVPMSYIKIGSETKGRIEISIPCYATATEARAIIDKHLDYLKYTSIGIESRDLDIFTTRK